MEYIGCDIHGNQLKLGDRCKFKIREEEHQGVIVYDRYNFAYAFDIDNLPIELLIWRVDTHSIEKI